MKYTQTILQTALGKTTLFCAAALLLAACGGGKSEVTGGGSGGSGEEDDDISLVGIPKSMVSAVCLDTNSNMLCEVTEELDYRYDFGGASIYKAPRNPPTGKNILVEISDPAKISHFDKTMLSFSNDRKILSMASKKGPISWEYTPIDETSRLKNDQVNLEFFLAHQQNLNLLGQNGLSAEEASDASIKEINKVVAKISDADLKKMVEELVNISGTGGNTGGRADFQDFVTISPEKAYEIAKEVRGTEKALVNDKLVEGYQCKAGLVKNVQHYGVEDVFNLSNGTEQTYPSASILADPNLAASAQLSSAFGGGFVNYDDTNNDRYFADEIKNLPTGIVDGRIYIGFKSNGSSLQHNDAVHIGAYGIQHYGEHLQDLINPANASSPWGHQLVNTSNPTTDVYWNDFANLNLVGGTIGATGNGGTLLTYVQANNNFDVFVQDDTSVDFITVATCSEKKPVVEITQVLEKYQCKASAGTPNETKVTILGGIVDAYANGADTATPSSALVNAAAIGYPAGTTNYDAQNYDKALIDTLTLPTSGYIASARLSVGIKALGSSLHSNDRIYLGYTDANNIAAFDLYGTASSSVNTNSEWATASISNGERVIQSNFNASSGANSLAWLRTQSAFDVLLQDDTSVDFIQVDLCMLEKPPFIDTDGDGFSDEQEIEAGSDPKNPSSTPNDIDGDGVPNEKDCDPYNPDVWENCKPELPASCNKEIAVDLRPASSWIKTATGSAPTVGNVFTGTQHAAVWDPALNWFNFGSASNTTHELKIDFCSCGEGAVKVDEMKSDNYSSVTLDGQMPPIVERTAYSQSTMATWGPSVSGTQTIPYSGNGVDRSLIFKVKNIGGPSGGGIDGMLNFTGHLGACTKEDVLPKK